MPYTLDYQCNLRVKKLLKELTSLTTSSTHLELLEMKKSPLTIESYMQDITTCYRFFAQKKNNEKLPHLPYDLASWRMFLMERHKNIQASTQKKVLISLKVLARYDVKLMNVLSQIKSPKVNQIQPKPIDFIHVKQLLNASENCLEPGRDSPLSRSKFSSKVDKIQLDSKTNSTNAKCSPEEIAYSKTASINICDSGFITNKDQCWIQQRDFALWMVLYGQGLRISEALNLTIDVFDATKSDLLIIHGKGDKIRTIPLLKCVYQAIETYLAYRPMSQVQKLFLHKTLKPLTRFHAAYLIKKLKDKLNLPDHTSCHKLRHSFVSHLVEGGASLKAIQQLAGHARLSTIQSYGSVSVKHLGSAHSKASSWEEE